MEIAEYLALADRLTLAGVFLLAGVTKQSDRAGSQRAMRDFGVPRGLAGPAGALLPWAELGVATALVVGPAAWYGAWGALGLLALFFLGAAWNLVRGRQPDCRCFGRLHSKPLRWSTVLRSGVLTAGAAWLVARGDGGVGPGVWAFFQGLNGAAHNIAVIILGIGCLAFFIALDRARPPVIVSGQPDTEDAPATADSDDPGAGRVRPQNIGLAVGMPAPEFEVAGMSGRTYSLASLREPGRTLMLVFLSPHCHFCTPLLPEVARWMREEADWLKIALVSRGTAMENREKVQNLGIEEVLLQRAQEVAETYDSSWNPSAVLIDEEGRIASGLIKDAEPIRELVATRRPARQS